MPIDIAGICHCTGDKILKDSLIKTKSAAGLYKYIHVVEYAGIVDPCNSSLSKQSNHVMRLQLTVMKPMAHSPAHPASIQKMGAWGSRCMLQCIPSDVCFGTLLGCVQLYRT